MRKMLSASEVMIRISKNFISEKKSHHGRLVDLPYSLSGVRLCGRLLYR